MEQKTDYIVYWVGDRHFTVWVSPAKARKIVNDKEKKVSTWLRS